MGSGLARFHDAFKLPVFVLALFTAVLLQILSNLANDLGDHQHGADSNDRIGPQRAVQSGAISPAAMKRAMVVCGLLAFICGCALIITAFGFSITMLAFLALGIAAIAAAVKYTFGKNPYGYAGLGDLSVFVFFGIVGVAGTYYLHTSKLVPQVVWPAIAIGSLSVGVLNLNNMRDITNDARHGKRTLPVRMGLHWAKTYHVMLIILAFIGFGQFTISDHRSLIQYSYVIGFPMLFMQAVRVHKTIVAEMLDPELKRLAILTFFTAITFSLGLTLA